MARLPGHTTKCRRREKDAAPKAGGKQRCVIRVSAREAAGGGRGGFGGTFAEVDGESDAVAVEAGEDHHLFAAWMAAEDGAHFFGVEDGAAPTVRNAHGCKGRVQMADAAFEPAETAGGLASANIVAVQIVRAVLS